MEKPSVLQSFFMLIGRICIAAIFILAGINKIMGFDASLAYMTAHNIPYTHFLLVLAIICELGAGILLFVGWFTRFAAFILILFIIATTFIFHAFWNYEAAQAVSQMQHFLKNAAIIGGLFYIMSLGAGRISFDGGRRY
ncbi:MAG: DoxX family protein [Pseudomonadota bacterium]